MTITQLEYILAVDKFRHFGKAAKACAITQPTLSMQLQKAEEEMGVVLFDRSKNPIMTTAEGEQIIEQARKVLREYEKIFSIIDAGKNEVRGDFRLGVIPTLAPYVIPLFAGEFVKKYPLNIIACKDCTLLQLDYIVDQNKVYHKKYPYLPGITKQVDLEQKEFADDVLKKISLNKNDLVIDIGSNDGNLLKHFKKKIKVLGVEPTNIAKIANKNKIKTIQSFFNPKTAKLIKNKFGKAKIITATNVFAHMSTLGDVMNSICLLLKEDGFFVFENHYIMPIILLMV
jgi:hypothetical protein